MTRLSADPDIAIADLIPQAHAEFAGPIFAAFAEQAQTRRDSDVAEAVFRAATDGTAQLRYPAGADAAALAA